MGERAGSYVAVVGAGLAGSVLATRLAAAPGAPSVLLFDPDPAGPGTAYATAVAGQAMNGPVRAMSAVPGDRGHLRRWLGSRVPEDALIPRARFGAYLRALVDEAVHEHANLVVVRREVTDLTLEDRRFVVQAGKERWYAANVVLALGNPLPRCTLVPDEVRADPRYVADPWRFDGRGVRGEVLALGTGLTALDVLIALDEAGFAGRIHLVSRHALVPLREDASVRARDPASLALDAATPLALLRTLRRAARAAAAAGEDWRPVVDAIRKLTPAIWEGWDVRERRRFLRHLQPYWSIHRYRVPPRTADVFEAMAGRGAVILHRGRVEAVRAVADGFRARVEGRSERDELHVAHIVNCTGPESDYLRIERPLVQNLLRRGFIRPDALRLGIDATRRFEVVGAHGEPWPNLFTLGPPLRGLWYETTGVPEVRAHAARLADALAARYGSGNSEAGGASVSASLSGAPDSTS